MKSQKNKKHQSQLIKIVGPDRELIFVPTIAMPEWAIDALGLDGLADDADDNSKFHADDYAFSSAKRMSNEENVEHIIVRTQ